MHRVHLPVILANTGRKSLSETTIIIRSRCYRVHLVDETHAKLGGNLCFKSQQALGCKTVHKLLAYSHFILYDRTLGLIQLLKSNRGYASVLDKTTLLHISVFIPSPLLFFFFPSRFRFSFFSCFSFFSPFLISFLCFSFLSTANALTPLTSLMLCQ